MIFSIEAHYGKHKNQVATMLEAFATVAAFATFAGTSPAVAGEKINLLQFANIVAQGTSESKASDLAVTLSENKGAQVGALPDPMISLSREELPLRLDSMAEKDEMAGSEPEPNPSWQLTLTQPIPWPGTLSADERAAGRSIAVAKAGNRLQQAERTFSAVDLFLDMVRTNQTVEVQRKILKDASAFRDFVHERYRHGIGDHSEFLQTHTESSLIAINLATMEANLANLKDHARTTIDRPDGDFLLTWPKDLDDKKNQNFWLVGDGNSSDLTEEIVREAARRDIAASEAAYKRTMPTINVSAMVMKEDGGMQSFGGMVGFGIPLYSGRQRDGLNRAASTIQNKSDFELAWYEKRKKLATSQNEVRIARLQENLRILDNDILPKISEHLEAAIAAFGQGKGKVTTVISGRRELLNYEVARIETYAALVSAKIAQNKIALGIIEDAINRPIPGVGGASMDSGSMNDDSAMGGATMGPGKMTKGSSGGKGVSPLQQEPDMEDSAPAAGSGSGMAM